MLRSNVVININRQYIICFLEFVIVQKINKTKRISVRNLDIALEQKRIRFIKFDSIVHFKLSEKLQHFKLISNQYNEYVTTTNVRKQKSTLSRRKS